MNVNLVQACGNRPLCTVGCYVPSLAAIYHPWLLCTWLLCTISGCHVPSMAAIYLADMDLLIIYLEMPFDLLSSDPAHYLLRSSI